MDDNKNLTVPNTNIANPSNNYALTRAKSFKVISPSQNYAQYIKTVKAYALAGMPFEHIANAGDHLGDLTERGEVNAAIEAGWRQKKTGEVVEDKSKLLAWQNRGETISVSHQLSSGTANSGPGLIPVSNALTSQDSQSPQTLNVLEGIEIDNKQAPAIPQNTISNTSDLENNPYLKVKPSS